jgi:cytochrome c oxidase cbb3-type subunit 3
MAMLEKHKHEHPAHDFNGLVEMRENAPPAYFSVLFYGLVIWGVVFCAYYLLSGWSSQEEFRQQMEAHRQEHAPAPMAPAATVTPAADGQGLFAQHCAACHGAAGKGGIGPDLTAAGLKYGRTAEAIRESIAGGRPGGMPAFGNQLAAPEIAALTEFVLGLKP